MTGRGRRGFGPATSGRDLGAAVRRLLRGAAPVALAPGGPGPTYRPTPARRAGTVLERRTSAASSGRSTRSAGRTRADGATTAAVRVLFDLDPGDAWSSVTGEQVWATGLGDDRYRVEDPPFFVRGVAVGDVVRARPVADQAYPVFAELVHPSDHVAVRLVCRHGGPLLGDLDQAAEPFLALGVRAEAAPHHGLLAMDIAPSLPLAAIKDGLRRGSAAGLWAYREGRTTPEWESC